MTKQLNALSSLGLLGRFVGMLTDSRSFLSYPRHEYFRRIPVQLVGAGCQKADGCPAAKWRGSAAWWRTFQYHNAKNYFGF